MANNYYYFFDSKNSLSTKAVSADIWTKAISEDDWSETGGRYIHYQLMFDKYPEELSFPVSYTVDEGRNFKDVLEMRRPSGFLISDRLLRLFEENKLTGWKSYEVIVRDKKGNIIPGYHGFTVTGKNPTDVENEGNVPDFFKANPNFLSIVCTKKVHDVIKSNKIKDFTFDRIVPGCGLLKMHAPLYESVKHLL